MTSSEPYDCDAGFANWQAGWSVPKKEWCCRVHDVVRALRLRCRIRQLDGRLVSSEESMVLREQGKGMSAGSWRMCLRVSDGKDPAQCRLPEPSSGAVGSCSR